LDRVVLQIREGNGEYAWLTACSNSRASRALRVTAREEDGEGYTPRRPEAGNTR
jgi:hypothetical protein